MEQAREHRAAGWYVRSATLCDLNGLLVPTQSGVENYPLPCLPCRIRQAAAALGELDLAFLSV